MTRPHLCALFLASMALAGLAGGCDGSAGRPAPAGETRRAASTQTSRPGVSPGRSVPASAVHDYVAEPHVDPSEMDAGPRRIVSMAPSLTELCWALGLGDRLIGRTQYCIYPPAARKVEVVGALLDPNIERILTLHPDLVLITQGSSMLKEKIAALHLPMHVLPADSLEDIFSAIRTLGQVTQRPKTAAALAQALRTDLAQLAQRTPLKQADAPPKVLFVTGALTDPPRSVWVAGPGSYLENLLILAGARSVVAGERPWLELSPEQAVWLAPDMIVEVREPAQFPGRSAAAAAWRNLPGLSGAQVVTLRDIAMVFPGPRVNVMLAKLIEGLQDAGRR